jgi:GNAT superfamily N-acetyltransferase
VLVANAVVFFVTKFALESFCAILPELIPLFELHWSETGLFRQCASRMPLRPDFAKYQYAEQNGLLLTLTARLEDKLVGYYIAVVQPQLHYSVVTGVTDIPYVHPSVRHRGIGVKLFLRAEQEMRTRKVQLWQAGSKLDSNLHPSMDRLLRHLKFEPTDLLYHKWLG